MRGHLKALTGLRFVAALHVVLFHVTAWSSWGAGPARDLVGCGYVAVGLFFVLSGFILAYTYLDPGASGASARADDLRPRAFYAARFARIYPVYAVGLAIAAPFFVRAHLADHTASDLPVRGLAVLTLTQSHVPTWALEWNSPAWSLSVEAFFYLLFPFVAKAIARLSLPAARAVAVAAWVASLALPLAYLAALPDGVREVTHATVAPWLDVIRYGPAARLPEFLVGIVLGRELLASRGAPSRSAHYLALGAFVALALLFAVSSKLPYLLLHNGLLVPLFAALIFGLARGGGGALSALLAARPMVVLGEASYSLYILHAPLLMALRSTAKAASPRLVDTTAFRATVIGVSVGASLLAYRWVEVPLRGRLRSALDRRRR